MPGPDAFAPVGADCRLAARYRLVGPIARGGMAEVWEGYDEILSRPVAVKILLSHLATDEVVRARFRQEAVTAARLAHPSVVATYDTGADGEIAYIVMELVRGQTLRQLLVSRGALPAQVAVSIADQIADALGHAHRAGLVHRDVKPANVLLTDEDGSVPRIKVTDFGIAKATEGVGMDLTSTGMVLGTPKYLSPEQVEGREPDARADLYSLGVVLFEMLTGRPPFAGPTEMATALAHLRDTPPAPSALRPGVSPALDRIVAVLLAKDPAGRFASAGDLRLALAGAGASPFANGSAAGIAPRAGSAAMPAVAPGDGGAALAPGAGDAAVAARPPLEPTVHRPALGGLAGPPAVAGAVGAPAGHGTSAEAAGTWWDGEARAPIPPPFGPGPRPSLRTRGDAPGGERSHDTPTAAAGDRSPAGLKEDPAPAGGRARRAHRRRTPGLVVLALLLAGAAVAAVLVTRTSPSTGGSGAAGGGPVQSGSLTLTSATVFVLAGHAPDDPAGAANVLDGNPATVWQTDIYGNAHFGNLYPGIGLALRLSATATLHHLTVVAPAGGWTAQTYVAATLPTDTRSVSVWGPPTDTKAGGTTTTFSLGGRSGGWILLWLTSTAGPPYRCAIADVTVD